MSRNQECSGCQMGNHKRHRRVVQAVPEGMIGGVVCPCKGECKDKTWEDMARSIGAYDLLVRTRRSGTVSHSGPRDNTVEAVVRAAESVHGIGFKTRRRPVNWFRRLWRLCGRDQ